ncbi:BspA family leucine-rich repeat surface protein [Spirochaeta africana]|uniref:PKD domain-containing protein n=1 Tax=Spirochaeta africana (strain ATCC 700263 / DSM 8902 / Z-7692) TaxID=889378 RepID=H9UHH9_SPIAZ|nr:BspA family leucine-rich repeat surface protein [Spirochaeta africana]AFG36972.1 protein of unknown function, DUF285 [Spirochaeta africana DSM 8902]
MELSSTEFAGRPCIITVGITDTARTFHLPAFGTYDVSWGDGTSSVQQQGPCSHTYREDGEYHIRISAHELCIRQYDPDNLLFPEPESLPGTPELIIDVQQWGDIRWTSMKAMFLGARNLTGFSANDTPDLSGVTDMSYMFSGYLDPVSDQYIAVPFNFSIADWDVSSVENMAFMFALAESFDQELAGWDVSKVSNMKAMFLGASSFNHAIGCWNVSRVSNMRSMFFQSHSFNQDISHWDVARVENMSSMFENAKLFNQDIGAWDVPRVKRMRSMFRGALAFDQDLSAWRVPEIESEPKNFKTDAASWMRPDWCPRWGG